MKRFIDIVITLFALAFLWPLLLLTAVLVRVYLGSPVLFRQARPGIHGHIFTLYKFRSMRDAIDSAGNPLPDEQRLPAFGIWLRKFSLDELPQLFNVLCGDMSLVGPRPLLIQYLERYTPQQARRHEVKPGITGWAQVNGRNAITWEQKFQYDVWYVDHQSMLLDFKILYLTLLKVIRRKDIAASGHATMPEFMGTQANSFRDDGDE